jgi:PAS domain S-box-containing protein
MPNSLPRPRRAGRTATARSLSPDESDDLLRALIDETPLAIYAKDRAQRFVLSNRQHAALIARPPEEILGRTDAALFGDESTAVDAMTQEVLAHDRAGSLEFELTLEGGRHTFLETVFPLHDPAGAVVGVGGFAADITARRALEVALAERAQQLEDTISELRAAQAQLVQQQKMAALGGLVAGVAHEVSSPLGAALTAATVVDGALQELDAAFQSQRLSRSQLAAALERMRHGAALTVRNIERAARLLQSFKQVAVDRAHVQMRPAMLSEWLDEVVVSLSPMARQHRVQLVTEALAAQRVSFAASELQQVLTNLVVNAIVHGYGDDPQAPAPTGERRVEVSLVASDDGVLLTVRDQGRGMSEDVAARAFDPFFTTRRGRGGTGLGLHITWTLVTERFGGRIEIETAPGQGTCFHVKLPWREASLCLAPSTPPPALG